MVFLLAADLDTPVSVYLKLCDAAPTQKTFLLESVEGGEHVARYSFIGAEPSQLVTIRDQTVTISNGHTEMLTTQSGNPLETLRELMRAYRAVRHQFVCVAVADENFRARL
jgi:anthranilate synthase component 1